MRNRGGPNVPAFPRSCPVHPRTRGIQSAGTDTNTNLDSPVQGNDNGGLRRQTKIRRLGCRPAAAARCRAGRGRGSTSRANAQTNRPAGKWHRNSRRNNRLSKLKSNPLNIGSITAIGDINVAYGTALSSANLPATVNVNMADGTNSNFNSNLGQRNSGLTTKTLQEPTRFRNFNFAK